MGHTRLIPIQQRQRHSEPPQSPMPPTHSDEANHGSGTYPAECERRQPPPLAQSVVGEHDVVQTLRLRRQCLCRESECCTIMLSLLSTCASTSGRGCPLPQPLETDSPGPRSRTPAPILVHTWNDTLPDPAVPLGVSLPVLPLNVGGGLPGALLLCQGTSSPTSSPMANRKSSSQMMQSQKVRR